MGFREPVTDEIHAHADRIDFLEVISERYISSSESLQFIKRLRETFRLIPHGLNLSVASPHINYDYLEKVKMLCDIIQPPYYSDHLCFTQSANISIGHLAPVSFTEDTLKTVIHNVRIIQDYLSLRLALENITFMPLLNQSEMSHGEFFHRLVDATGCGILLDVTNVQNNAYNQGFDARAYVDSLPLDHVLHFHIAGGFINSKNVLIDSHSLPVHESSWEILNYCAKKGVVRNVVLEHDDNFPSDFTELTHQLTRAKEVMTLQSTAARI